MEQTGLVAIQPKSFKPRTTESRHRLGYSPNLLLEGIEVEKVNQVWVGDITYIPLSDHVRLPGDADGFVLQKDHWMVAWI